MPCRSTCLCRNSRERVVSVEVRNPGLRSAAPVSVRIVYSVARPGVADGDCGCISLPSVRDCHFCRRDREEVDGFLVWANEAGADALQSSF